MPLLATQCIRKGLAEYKTVWLVLSTLFEYIGLYNNRCPNDVALSFGNASWVVLFRAMHDFRPRSKAHGERVFYDHSYLCHITIWIFTPGPQEGDMTKPWGFARERERESRCFKAVRNRLAA